MQQFVQFTQFLSRRGWRLSPSYIRQIPWQVVRDQIHSIQSLSPGDLELHRLRRISCGLCSFPEVVCPATHKHLFCLFLITPFCLPGCSSTPEPTPLLVRTWTHFPKGFDYRWGSSGATHLHIQWHSPLPVDSRTPDQLFARRYPYSTPFQTSSKFNLFPTITCFDSSISCLVDNYQPDVIRTQRHFKTRQFNLFSTITCFDSIISCLIDDRSPITNSSLHLSSNLSTNAHDSASFRNDWA